MGMMKRLIPCFLLRGRLGRIAVVVFVASLLALAWLTRDERAWLGAYREGAEPALASFVAAFPDSPYVGAANAAIRSLRWDAARGHGSSVAFAGFLKSYPTGPYSTQLRVLAERQVTKSLLVSLP